MRVRVESSVHDTDNVHLRMEFTPKPVTDVDNFIPIAKVSHITVDTATPPSTPLNVGQGHIVFSISLDSSVTSRPPA